MGWAQINELWEAINSLKQGVKPDFSQVSTEDLQEGGINLWFTNQRVLDAILSGFETDFVQFNTSYTETGTEPQGTMFWSDTEHGLEFVVDEYGNITIGKELWDILTNLEGATIVNGDVISIVGATGNRTAMALTDATDKALALACCGMVTIPSIAKNNHGRITKRGKVRGLNTSAFAEGAMLYVDPLNKGKLTDVEPTAGNYIIKVGVVQVSHATVGVIDLKILTIPKITDLSDVNGTALTTTGQVLVWDNEEGYFDPNFNINDYAKDVSEKTKEKTGYTSPKLVVITGNSVTRTVTITGTCEALYQNVVLADMVSGWVSPVHPDNSANLYYLYYNGTDYIWSTTIWEFYHLQIAIAKYDEYESKWIYARECHGTMPYLTHQEFHDNLGSYKIPTGGDFSNVVLNSTTEAERRPYISSFTHNDEDCPTIQPALTTNDYTQAYLRTTGLAYFPDSQTDIVPLLVNNPYYNQFTTEWVQTLMPANSVMSIWVVSFPACADASSQKHRFLWGQGQWITQAQNSSPAGLLAALNAERLRTFSEMNLGDLSSYSPELLLIGRIIITYTGGNWSITYKEKISGSSKFLNASPAGNFLSSASVDYTMTGNGTAINPLGQTPSTTYDADTPLDADVFEFYDVVDALIKKITWANIKATIKTYFDTVYQAILVSGTNIKTINSATVLGSGDLEVEYRPTTTTVTLTVAGWSGGTSQVATVTGATATNRLKFSLPSTDAQIMEIVNKQVRPTPSTQTTDALTFVCTTTPTVEISMVCEILPAL